MIRAVSSTSQLGGRTRRVTKTARVHTNTKVHNTGYLNVKSSQDLVVKKYYFVLTDESLIYYRKKNDNRPKGEIYLPCRCRTVEDDDDDDGNDNASNHVNQPPQQKKTKKKRTREELQIIPLKLDQYSNEFREKMDECITVIGSKADESERQTWIEKIHQMSQVIMEPFIFPDAMNIQPQQSSSHFMMTDMDAEQKYNTTVNQQQEHQSPTHLKIQDQLSAMLDTNYFGVNKAQARWRTPLSLRGLNSDEDIEDLLKIGVMQPTHRMLPSNCLSIHSSSNLVAVGNQTSSLDDDDDMHIDSNHTVAKNVNQGIIQIFKLNEEPVINNTNNTHTNHGRRNTNSSNHEYKANNNDGDDNHNARVNEIEYEFDCVHSFDCDDGIVCMDWREHILLVGSNAGRVFCYQTKHMDDDHDSHDDSGSDSGSHSHSHSKRKTKHKKSAAPPPTVYNYSKQKNTLLLQNMSSAPGSWMTSPRVNNIAISRMTNPDCFLSLQNEWFHLWSFTKTARPIFSQKASTSPLFCLEWNPHHAHQFMVAGVSRNLKMIDTRALTTHASQSVPWRIKEAHAHLIRDIAWSPLIPYWIGTCSDDGAVKIWDQRMNAREPMARLLEWHNNAVTQIDWSRSHPELLISSSVDRSVNLWNIRRQCEPYYLLYAHTFGSSVIGCGFSSVRPMQFYALSSIGELKSIELTAEFCRDFVPHRFKADVETGSAGSRDGGGRGDGSGDSNERAREIERLLYMRDMKAAHARIPGYAEQLWNNGEFAKAQELLNLVSTVGFESILQRAKVGGGRGGGSSGGGGGRQQSQFTFDDVLRKICTFYHRKCLKISKPNEKDVQFCELMKLRMFIRKVLKKKEWQKLLLMEAKIFKRFFGRSMSSGSGSMKKSSNHSKTEDEFQIVSDIIALLKCHSYVNAVQWSLKILDIYQKIGKFALFQSISMSLFYPTIYHFHNNNHDGNSTHNNNTHRSVDPSLLRNASHILEKKLNDSKFVKWELNLLKEMHDCIGKSKNASLHVIRVWNKQVSHKNKKSRRFGNNLRLESKEEEEENHSGNDSGSSSEEDDDGDGDDGDNAPDMRQIATLLSMDSMSIAQTAANASVNHTNSVLDEYYYPLSQTIHRLYFNALLNVEYCDTFFIECSKLIHKSKGYEFAFVVSDLIENVGYIQLNEKLKSHLRFEDEAESNAQNENENRSQSGNNNHNNTKRNAEEEQLKKCFDGLITIVNICENCFDLPQCLKLHLPSHLKKFSFKIQELYNHNNNNARMMKLGNILILRIDKIKKNKISNEFFFRNEISNITSMVKAFCSQ